MIHFAHPERFWLLAIFPPLLLWAGWGAHRRARAWSLLGQWGLPRKEGARGWVVAMACLVIALAQPRWGRLASSLPPGHDLVLAVDVSRSMGAEDAVPNRLAVAVESAQSLLNAIGHEPGSRAAVVAFAGQARLRCPLTENLGAVVEALHGLKPGGVQPGGTNLGAAIRAAIDAFDDREHAEGRTIVVFSDGEDHVNSWTDALERAHLEGVIVHAVAIGDREHGHTVPSGTGIEHLRYQGTTVLTKRNDGPLEALAQATGGTVVPLGLASADLGSLYRTRIAPVAQQVRESSHPPERAERFALFTLGAFGLGLGGAWLSAGYRPSLRLWLLVLPCVALGAGADPTSPASFIQAGQAAYLGGRYDEALRAFERAIERAPDNPIGFYNAAAALFRLERFPDALARYQDARTRADRALQVKIDYALGNTALAIGDVRAAMESYDACLASTATGAGLAAVRQDAQANRQFAEEEARRNPNSPEGNDSNNPPGEQPREPDPDAENPNAKNPQSPNPDDAPSNTPGRSARGGPQRDKPDGAHASGADSPEEKLAQALHNIGEARKRRIDDAPPPPDENRKDW